MSYTLIPLYFLKCICQWNNPKQKLKGWGVCLPVRSKCINCQWMELYIYQLDNNPSISSEIIFKNEISIHQWQKEVIQPSHEN